MAELTLRKRDYMSGSDLREPSKSESRDQRWGCQRFKIWVGFDRLLLVWRCRGPHNKECRWPLGAVKGPQMQPAWKWGPQSYDCKDLNLPQPRERGRGCQTPDEKPGWHLDFNLGNPWAENPVMQHLDSCPIQLWANKWVLVYAAIFVMICYAAIEN